MSNTNRFYKYCIVPGCKNTTFTAPNKYFVHVPRVKSLRDKWWEAMKKDPNTKNNVPFSSKSSRFCCEDHFDFKNDMQNYLKWKMMGGNIWLKKGVVPHIFDGQKSVVEKSGQIPLMNDTNVLEEAVQGTSTSPPKELIDCGSTELAVLSVSENENDSDTNDYRNFKFNELHVYRNKKHARRKNSGDTQNTQAKLRRLNSPMECPASSFSSLSQKLNDANSTLITSNIQTIYANTSSNNSPNEERSLFEPENDLDADPENQFELIMLTGTMMSIQKDPKLFLGISIETRCFLDTVSQLIPCDYKDILITLKKIRLNEPCTLLAMQFATSATIIEEVFQRTVSLMSKYFKKLIYWPTSRKVLKHLPLIFRARYSNVYCMLDILEVEIRKPDSPLHQCSTWSENKNCSLIKYLITSTPDGLILFTSDGFGGKTSDMDVLLNCGLMENLSPGLDIITERNFKHADQFFTQRSCKLIWLPNVLPDIPRSKEHVMESKRTEALQFHLQSVTNSFCNFKMLTPHFNSTFISKLDDVVVIVSGLMNLGSSFDL